LIKLNKIEKIKTKIRGKKKLNDRLDTFQQKKKQ